VPIPGTGDLVRRVTSVGFSPDGKLAVLGLGATPGVTQPEAQVLAVPLTGGTAPISVLTGTGLTNEPAVSPDGRWIAYASLESGRVEVYVRPFPTGAGRLQISTEGGTEPRWSPDGRRLFYRSRSTYHVLTLDMGAAMPRVVHADSPATPSRRRGTRPASTCTRTAGVSWSRTRRGKGRSSLW
jgi:Tol biopolymer transport system component